MDVARLNCAFWDRRQVAELVPAIRDAAARAGRPVATLLDLGGPKVRTGTLLDGRLELAPGQRLRIVPGDDAGRDGWITCNHSGLPDDVLAGDAILLDDGRIELRVLSVEGGGTVACEVVRGGVLLDRKGLNVPARRMSLPSLGDKDRGDLAAGIEAGVDFVALSFVQSASDVADLREEVSALHSDVPIIAKIERPQAVDDIGAILSVADGILLARGDLAVEVGNHRVPMIQKDLLRRAGNAGRMGIVATQMLESMTRGPCPTRAEVSDVANAILDGASSLTLSGETAVGLHPDEAIRVIDRIAREVEPWMRQDDALHIEPDAGPHITMAIVRAAARIASDRRFSALVVFTLSGRTARLLLGHFPAAPIFALTPDQRTLRRMAAWRGVVPVLMPFPDNSDEMVAAGERRLVDLGLLREGEEAIVVSGFLKLKGVANMVKVVRV